MKTTLESLFTDGIHPFEEIIPKDPAYRAVHRQIGEETQYFIQKLPPEHGRRFEELENLYSRSASLYGCDCFIYGFRLGALLMGEAFTGGE